MNLNQTNNNAGDVINISQLLMYEFILRVLKAFAENEDCDSLGWTTNPLTFHVDCNDLFYWGTSDSEEVTPQNIQIYEDTAKELKALGKFSYFHTHSLFCCRSRKMRPQGMLLSTKLQGNLAII